MKKLSIIIFCLVFLPLGLNAAAYSYDLGIQSSDICFSQPADALVEQTPVRIYATIRNYGSEDVAASVIFYNGPNLIGESQAVSVRAGGLADEVYVDWTVPSGSFNIMARIKAPDPADQNLQNNQAITPLIIPLKDTDGDKIPDIDDPDDDNDGLSDEDESNLGTDQADPDSDNDGVNDGSDAYPTDASKSQPDAEPEILAQAVIEPADIDNHQNANDTSTDVQNNQSAASSQTSDDQKVNSNSEDSGDDEEEIEYDTQAYQALQTVPGFDLLSDIDIVIKKQKWGTYNFNFNTNVENIDSNELIFEWDFGDGNKSTSNLEYSYKRAGTYYVKLKVLGPWQNTLTDVQVINVPFWSVENYTMWGLVLFLIVAVLVLILTGRKSKKEK